MYIKKRFGVEPIESFRKGGKPNTNRLRHNEKKQAKYISKLEDKNLSDRKRARYEKRLNKANDRIVKERQNAINWGREDLRRQGVRTQLPIDLQYEEQQAPNFSLGGPKFSVADKIRDMYAEAGRRKAALSRGVEYADTPYTTSYDSPMSLPEVIKDGSGWSNYDLIPTSEGSATMLPGLVLETEKAAPSNKSTSTTTNRFGDKSNTTQKKKPIDRSVSPKQDRPIDLAPYFVAEESTPKVTYSPFARTIWNSIGASGNQPMTSREKPARAIPTLPDFRR